MIVKCSNASALLLVFAISFFLTFFGMRCWYQASLICDIQNQRELYYKQFYLTEKILDLGIKLACKSFINFLKFKVPTNVDLGIGEIEFGFIAEFMVSKVPKKDKLLLTASLINKHEVKCNLKCILERKTRSRVAKNADKHETYFIVNNFILSSSL